MDRIRVRASLSPCSLSVEPGRKIMNSSPPILPAMAEGGTKSISTAATSGADNRPEATHGGCLWNEMNYAPL